MAPTTTFLNCICNCLHLVVRHFENIVQAVEHNLHNLRVLDIEKVTKRRDNALRHDVSDLFFSATDSQITDGPGGFLLRLELTLYDNMTTRITTGLSLPWINGGLSSAPGWR